MTPERFDLICRVIKEKHFCQVIVMPEDLAQFPKDLASVLKFSGIDWKGELRMVTPPTLQDFECFDTGPALFFASDEAREIFRKNLLEIHHRAEVKMKEAEETFNRAQDIFAYFDDLLDVVKRTQAMRKGRDDGG